MKIIINTRAFTLRPFRASDAASLQKNINNRVIARNTLHIPYPYRLKDAREWIVRSQKEWRKKQPLKMAWAIDVAGEVIGGVGLHLSPGKHKAELGYWLARKYWGKGIITKVVRMVVRLGFNKLKLKRIYAFTFPWNIASGRVLAKNGFKREGYLRKNVKKGNNIFDDYLWAKIQ